MMSVSGLTHHTMRKYGGMHLLSTGNTKNSGLFLVGMQIVTECLMHLEKTGPGMPSPL